jgi:hypothetical protein
MKLIRYALLLLLTLAPSAWAWDYEGHRVVNQIALACLPTNFPAFVFAPEAAERIAFLSGEPDRWRNVTDLTLKHCNGPDHYIDLEQLKDYSLRPEGLPVFRYDFVALLATNRAAYPSRFPSIDPAQNTDHTRELVGFLPWSIVESYGKLKSGFSYLKTFQESGGTPEEIAGAKANILYIMGVMGHYVGDAAQPLHTTIHHAGWAGDNPHDYTTWKGFHQWIDGGYFNKVGVPEVAVLKSRLRPAQRIRLGDHAARAEEIFPAMVQFIETTANQVEPLYQLDKERGLSGNDENGMRGKEFLTKQLVAGGLTLGDLWYCAWQDAPPDDYLKRKLEQRIQPETQSGGAK